MKRVGALLAVVWVATAARAERPRSFALNLVREAGAESCISSQRLASSIEHWVGPVFVAAGDAEFAIETLLRRDGDRGWHARVVVSDGSGALLGERELHSSDADCHGLDRQLLLVIALAIDPEFSLRGLPEELLQTFPGGADAAPELLHELRSRGSLDRRGEAGSPHLTDEISARSAPDAGVGAGGMGSDHSARAPAGTWSWEVGAGFASAWGLLPRLAAGPAIAVGVVPPSFWPVRVSGGIWFENDAALAAPATRGAAIHFSMLQFGVSVCPALLQERSIRLRVCGGLLAAHRGTDSRALEAGIDVRRTSLGPVLEPEFGYQLRPWLWLTAGISVHTPLGRDAFTYIDQFGTKHLLFRPAFAAVWGQLGVSFRL